MQQKVVVIGGGVGGLAAACLLGKAGYAVTVLEKNAQLGGRAGQLRAKGFTFDTGPSWYLMPEVFERFFTAMGERVEDHLRLVKLAPSYRVFYKGGQELTMTGDLARDMATFESIEPGAGQKLKAYLERAAYIYSVSADRFLYKNYTHWGDFMTPDVVRASTKLPLFSSLHRQIAKSFRDPRLQQVLEFPAMFLGASPYNTPALFSLMNHVTNTQGVRYPMGGMYEVVQVLVKIGKKHGVAYKTNTPAEKILAEQGRARAVAAAGRTFPADIIISDAGRQHTETVLLDAVHRDRTPRYWRGRTLAPSALLLCLGVSRQYPSLTHHNLVFSKQWRRNFQDIFKGADFPADPSFYVCAPSKTDPSVAPQGAENLFVLVPVAAGLQYTPQHLNAFAGTILETMERELHLPALRQHIVCRKQFCVDDFASQFNAPGGTGLGLAHTLRQTGLFRPANTSKKVCNLYFVGADVHPGIGLPSVLISAQLAFERITA